MGITLRTHWDRLRSSFWFLPALMVSGAILLAQIGHGGSREAGPDEGAELPEAFAERARPVQYASDFAEKEPVMLRSISQPAGLGASCLRRRKVRRVGTAGTARL